MAHTFRVVEMVQPFNRRYRARVAEDTEEVGDCVVEAEWSLPQARPVAPERTLYLKHIAFAGDHLVQNRINKESDKEPRDQTCNNDDGKGFLRVRADSG